MAGAASNLPVIDDGLDYAQKKYVGHALIVNNVTFGLNGQGKQIKERNGSNADAEAVEKILRDLQFKGFGTKKDTDQMVFNDLTKDDLEKIMIEVSKKMDSEDYDDYGCFLCVIMSYGEPGVVYCRPSENSRTRVNEPCELKHLQEPFKNGVCKNLTAKPKIFLVQACPYQEETEPCGDRDKVKTVMKLTKIPRESDFLIHFSEQPGSDGWNKRNDKPSKGGANEKKEKPKNSEYIAALVQALKDLKDGNIANDFLRMLTRVNNYMVTNQADTDKQMCVPLVTSTLTKRLVLKLPADDTTKK